MLFPVRNFKKELAMKMRMCALSLIGACCLSQYAYTATVLVADTNNNRVLRYEVDGGNWTLDGTFASGSYAGTAMALPLGLTLDGSGTIYVGEQRDGGRILKFDSDGNFSGILATEGSDFVGRPEALAIGPDGNLFMSVAFGTTSDRLYRIDPTNGSVQTLVASGLNNPRGLAFDADGTLYVADRDNNRIVKYDAESGSSKGTLASITRPQGLLFDQSANGMIATVYTKPNILGYTLGGTSTTLYQGTASDSFIGLARINGELYTTAYGGSQVCRLVDSSTLATVLPSGTLNGPGHLLVLPEMNPTGPTDMKAHWQFDELSGSVAADAKGFRDGQVASGVGMGQAGVFAAAYAFDGQGGRVRIQNSTALVPATGDFTFCAWISTDDPHSGSGGQGHLFSNNNGQAGRMNLYIQDGTLWFF